MATCDLGQPDGRKAVRMCKTGQAKLQKVRGVEEERGCVRVCGAVRSVQGCVMLCRVCRAVAICWAVAGAPRGSSEEGCIAAARGVLCVLRTAALSRRAAALTGHVHPASLLPQLVPWAQCSGATHGTAGLDLGRKAVLGAVL